MPILRFTCNFKKHDFQEKNFSEKHDFECKLFCKKHDFEWKKFCEKHDFELKIFRLVRFRINFFTTRQILNLKFYNLAELESVF